MELNLLGPTLDPRITFTRASTATAWGPTGVLQTVSNDQPRFDHNPVTGESLGLLIEEQRTNLLTYSEDGQTAWTLKSNTSIGTNVAAAPDGNSTADSIIESTANGGHYIERNITQAANTPLSYTIFVKKNGRSDVWLNLYGNSYADSLRGSYNLDTGVTGTSVGGTGSGATASMQSVGNGWYRLTLSGTPSTSAVTDLKVRLSIINGSTTYTGDGASGFFLWGAQLEAGSFATSYIPTVAAQVTRSADAASMTGTNFSSWYRQDAGTIFGEYVGVNNISGGTRRLVEISNGTAGDRFVAGYGATNSSRFLVVVSNVTQADVSPAVTQGSLVRFAGAYAANDFQAAANTALGTADTSGTVPTVSQMNIGASALFAPGTDLNGHIRRLAYYPARLSNTQLQALTA